MMPQRTKKVLEYGKTWEYRMKEFFTFPKRIIGGVLLARPDRADQTQRCFMTAVKNYAARTASPVVDAGNILRFGTTFSCNTTKQQMANMNNWCRRMSTLECVLKELLL